MRENRFIETPLAEGCVDDILRRKKMELVTAHASDLKSNVIARMKEHDISQLPVVGEDDRYLGMVTELDLLNHLLSAEQHDPGESIEKIMSRDAAAVVEPQTPLSALSEVFSQGQVAVALEDNKVAGIVTKIDLIDYLAGRSR